MSIFSFIESTTDKMIIKSLDKSGLVQVEVQVKGKNGQIFTRKQWKKVSDVESSNHVVSSPNIITNTNSKQKVQELTKGKSIAEVIQLAKDNGITWKENTHQGINLMRCKMAMAKAIEEGRWNTKPTPTPNTPSIEDSISEGMNKLRECSKAYYENTDDDLDEELEDKLDTARDELEEQLKDLPEHTLFTLSDDFDVPITVMKINEEFTLVNSDNPKDHDELGEETYEEHYLARLLERSQSEPEIKLLSQQEADEVQNTMTELKNAYYEAKKKKAQNKQGQTDVTAKAVVDDFLTKIVNNLPMTSDNFSYVPSFIASGLNDLPNGYSITIEQENYGVTETKTYTKYNKNGKLGFYKSASSSRPAFVEPPAFIVNSIVHNGIIVKNDKGDIIADTNIGEVLSKSYDANLALVQSSSVTKDKLEGTSLSKVFGDLGTEEIVQAFNRNHGWNENENYESRASAVILSLGLPTVVKELTAKEASDYHCSGYFSPTYGSIHVNSKKILKNNKWDKYETVFHELGHACDKKASILIHNNRDNYYSLLWKNGAFIQAIKEDVEEKIEKEIQNLMINGTIEEQLSWDRDDGKSEKEILENLYYEDRITTQFYKSQNAIKNKPGYKLDAKNPKLIRAVACAKIARDLSDGGASYYPISDIYGGATLNEINGGFSHQDSYWKRDPDKNLATEAFANFTAGTIYAEHTDEGNTFMQEYLPKAFKAYVEMCEDMCKLKKV